MDLRAFFWKKTATQYIDQIVSIAKSGAELAGVADKAKIARDWADFETRGDHFSVDIFKEYGIPAGRPLVLLTGGSSLAKGSLNAAQAFLKLENKNSICVVLGGTGVEKRGIWGRFKVNVEMLVGKYPDWYRLRRLAENSDRIFLLPTVLCVKQFMEAAQLVVCVYAIPHCAKPVIEAGLLSKVAIVADNPEGLEYVRDGETGFVVPYGDPNLLVEKMDAVLSKSVDVAQMERNARAFIEKEFSKEKSMKAIMASILE
jgi:glycosyltransferase involved in cell wall biosynthesis